MKHRFITLTWELIRDKGTTMQEKLVLMEINQLTSLKKGCYASNEHFAELLGVKKQSICRTLKSLSEKGFITTKIKGGSRNHHRTIICNKMLLIGNKMLPESKQNVTPSVTKCLETKENNTINNTESNSAHLFLQNNYPERWNVWQMQNKKQIDNYDKFLLDFNDKVTIEKIEYDGTILFARLNTFARNWIINTKKSKLIKLPQDLPASHPSLKKIKYN